MPVSEPDSRGMDGYERHFGGGGNGTWGQIGCRGMRKKMRRFPQVSGWYDCVDLRDAINYFQPKILCPYDFLFPFENQSQKTFSTLRTQRS